MTAQTISIKDELMADGGIVVDFTCEGIDFFSVCYESTSVVEVYDNGGELVAEAKLDDNFETCVYSVGDDDRQSSAQLYFEHQGKTEVALARDLGQYLAAICFY